MNSDVENLLRAATYDVAENSANLILATLVEGMSGPAKVEIANTPASASSSDSAAGGSSAPGAMQEMVAASRESGQVAVEMKKLVDAATATQAANVPPPTQSSAKAAAEGQGIGETLMRTAAMMTGVGPLVTGLFKLFGSSESEPVPALEKFSAPAGVSVQAALTRDREYSSLRYAQGDTPEAMEGSSSAKAQAATIQVNIQAMDSQSFLDRQDDIARAVREAMLHSNSLNDVVMEL